MLPRLHFLSLPVALVAGLLLWPGSEPQAAALQAGRARTMTFCFWNVENCFDDKVDPGRDKADREFDQWYAKDREALKVKLDRICQVLLGKDLNAGQGPDILALAELESTKRTVDLIRDALNSRLKDKRLHYTHSALLDPRGGRSITTAVLSRSPIVEKKTRLLGRLQRILKVHVQEGKHELVVIASHWTSRISDTDGRGRNGYAETIHKDLAAMYRDKPEVDYLVCGDFNDTPEDRSVAAGLGASGDLKKVLGLGKKDRPLFYNPFGDLAKAKKGTHYYRGQPFVFDQICLSPGLLDGEGWSYVNRSARIVEQLSFRGRPDRFGGPSDGRPWKNRGASDHYPVTVQLRVQ